jgi:hypothetical protein
MTREIRPGRTPTVAELRRAQDHHRLVLGELTRVRAAALAWRNGVAALLAGLLGFGLIKGRSEVDGLPPEWSAIVGLLLLASLIAGAGAALALLRASHGRPGLVATADLSSSIASDHIEAVASARALRSGILLGFLCMALLIAAVGTTWYGPERDAPRLQITNGTTNACGTVIAIRDGKVTLKNGSRVTVTDLTTAQDLQPVASCGGK